MLEFARTNCGDVSVRDRKVSRHLVVVRWHLMLWEDQEALALAEKMQAGRHGEARECGVYGSHPAALRDGAAHLRLHVCMLH